MCCNLYDDEYPMLDSNYPRVNPTHGRVGSLFSDADLPAGSQALTNSDVPQKMKLPAEDVNELNLDTDQQDEEIPAVTTNLLNNVIQASTAAHSARQTGARRIR